jgi:hypothetical protein
VAGIREFFPSRTGQGAILLAYDTNKLYGFSSLGNGYFQTAPRFDTSFFDSLIFDAYLSEILIYSQKNKDAFQSLRSFPQSVA